MGRRDSKFAVSGNVNTYMKNVKPSRQLTSMRLLNSDSIIRVIGPSSHSSDLPTIRQHWHLPAIVNLQSNKQEVIILSNVLSRIFLSGLLLHYSILIHRIPTKSFAIHSFVHPSSHSSISPSIYKYIYSILASNHPSIFFHPST